jgi:FkbH-like protein
MPFQFAISATFTAEPIETVLAFWGRQLKWPTEVRFAPFNQVAQSLLDPASVLARNTEGVNVILVRPEDLGSSDDLIREHVHELADLTVRARHASRVPFIFVVCPGSPAIVLRDTEGIRVLQPEDVERLYPVEEIFSAEGDRLGRVAYTESYFAALGTTLARLAYAQVAAPFKVIALDCDNTLWQGICGEDGAAGVVIDGPRRALQQFMAAQRDAGMLLALASKNNEADVLDVFERRPEMPLRLEHFVSRRLNWEPKSASLASLAAELSLSPDSFLFVDDSPLECAEVQENLPQVFALALPSNAAEIAPFLYHVWAFDHPVVTAEDRRRSESYAQTLAFSRELRSAGSMEHFLDTLNLRVTFVPPTPERLPRMEQLTQRTNQFNFTTIRRTAAEISSLVSSGWECLGVEVSDRFGDYGLTGLLVFRVQEDALEIDTFLLSCRVLGRGVEHRLMNRLAEEALQRGLHTITGRFIPTARNEPARQFLRSITGDAIERYRISAEVAARAGWTPQGPSATVPIREPAPSLPNNRPDYAYIARHLSSASDILAAMRAEARGAQPVASGWESETEASLATIWRELLRKPEIKPNDNFFDLGGHSLLVVLLIVRVRETLGVELPIEDVYSGDLTLRSLASTIDRRKAGVDVDYEAMMDEISRMSDEEVLRLLAESE